MKEEEIKYNEIEDLDYCLELLEKRDKEIERLEYLNNQVVEECQNLDDEVLKLNNIIKEVREELKILKELEDFSVVKLQLTNIIFRLDKGE